MCSHAGQVPQSASRELTHQLDRRGRNLWERDSVCGNPSDVGISVENVPGYVIGRPCPAAHLREDRRASCSTQPWIRVPAGQDPFRTVDSLLDPPPVSSQVHTHLASHPHQFDRLSTGLCGLGPTDLSPDCSPLAGRTTRARFQREEGSDDRGRRTRRHRAVSRSDRLGHQDLRSRTPALVRNILGQVRREEGRLSRVSWNLRWRSPASTPALR